MALKTYTLADIAGKVATPFVFGTHSSEVALWFAQYQAGGNDGIVALSAAGRTSLKRAMRTASGLPFRTKKGTAKKGKTGKLGKAPILKLTPNTAEAEATLAHLKLALREIADMPTADGYKVLQVVSTDAPADTQ
jgi:hypothetical protein